MRISDWSSDVCSSDLLYGARLTEEGEVDQAWIEAHVAQFTELLEGEFEAAKSYLPNKADWFGGRWSGLSKPAGPETERRNVETAIGKDELQALGRTLTTVPEDVQIHKTLGYRKRSVEGTGVANGIDRVGRGLTK